MTPEDLSSPRFRAVVANTFAADGARDAAAFVARLTDDARFQLGGQPAVIGKAAIEAMLVQTFAAFAGVEHRLIRAVEAEDRDLLVYEAEVTYRFANGGTASAPYVNVLDFAGELVKGYRIYLDLSVLAQR
jgi:ketosteroid isomerase-like protein